MKEKSSNSKQILLSVLGVAILVVAVVGVSFAAFSYSQTGQYENKITTGVISMSYSNPSNGINLTNALPTTDNTGKALTGTNNVFDFSVSATISGTATINYAITATTTPATTLTDSFVKVYLTDRGTGGDDGEETQVLAPTLVSALTKTGASEASGAPQGQFVLKTGTFSATTTDNYRLRMWVADTFTGTSASETYKLRVNVYGKATAR